MHQAFIIGNSRSATDTGQYLPDSDAILHYHGRRAFVVSGQIDEGTPFDQHSIGLFGIEGHEGTFRDAEDGELAGCNVEHGRVDSILRFNLSIDAHESKRLRYWIAAGVTVRDALEAHKFVQTNGVDEMLSATVNWWHNWLAPAMKASEAIKPIYRRQFLRSAMLIKAHTDKRGALIASTDSSMLNYWRDAYAYCWPRDGAYALWPLIRLGYTEEPKNFFNFCKNVLHPSGYMMHKYQADGALGSSWHPYVHGNEVAPPIQEDETALVLFMFAQFYHMQEDQTLLEEFYDDFISPMANFLCEYVDPATNLPKPSYDLWEEQYMVTTYTTAVVVASLSSSAELAEAFHRQDDAVRWRSRSEDIHIAAQHYLFNPERQMFYKGIRLVNGKLEPDDTIDTSAFYGSFMFGLFPSGSEEIQLAYQSLKSTLDSGTEALPRYETDNYQRISADHKPNPWFITSLWMAQYAINQDDIDRGSDILNWVQNHADESGNFSEQLHPDTYRPLSVSPLIWSHAEFMATVLDLHSKEQDVS